MYGLVLVLSYVKVFPSSGDCMPHLGLFPRAPHGWYSFYSPGANLQGVSSLLPPRLLTPNSEISYITSRTGCRNLR